ncbi:hypothetical protein DWU99_18675 [Dyella psychrodurans]|uniref:Heme utilization protein n=1 Tax=Dyella psychrodurans TaxID=1927960 RepID=A0A370WWT7_9GAMM|nr:hypothetical protein DWU99_18675 [Dyella psychrodurans]
MIALAVVGAFGASVAYAHDDGGNSSSVKISKKVSLRSDININGDPRVSGQIDINAAAVALSNTTQTSAWNTVGNHHDVANTSDISGNVGENASGNVGVNQASGDYNAQGNSAAIAAAGSSTSDTSFTFDCQHGGGCGNNGGGSDPNAGGMADAETFTSQSVHQDRTWNHGTTNSSNISGNAFDNASGNVGVNQASGDNNEQSNSLAAATTSNNVYALATSTLDQEITGNSVSNDPGTLGWCSYPQATTNTSVLKGNVAANFSGNLGINQAAGTGNAQSNSLSMAVANP